MPKISTMIKYLKTFKQAGVIRLKAFLTMMGFCSKPNFIIIGAQKAGTTGLFSILNKHSLIIGSPQKEIHYFDDDLWYSKKKISSYHFHFPLPHNVNRKAKLFEATPIYLFHPEVAQRLYNYNPKLKLIILLRNPAERAFSAWTMYHHHSKTGRYRHLHDPRSFDEAINEEMKDIEKSSFHQNKIAYIKRGIYHYQIEEYLKYFPKEQLLFIESNAIKKQFENTLNNIHDFVEVPREKQRFIEVNKSRVSEKKNYEKEIQNLKNFYRPHNDKLYHLIGEKYDWNNEL
jgi:hypothetical protein